MNKCLLNVRLICLVDLTIFACRLDLAMVKLHESRRIRYNDCLMELVDNVLSLLGKTQRKAITSMHVRMKATKPVKKTNKAQKARKAKKARKA